MPANDKEAHVPIWFTLKIGGAEAAGFFKEATGFDSESEVTEIKRSMPNGKTDVIKAMGNTKWALPAKQFRGRYQLKLNEGNSVLS